jgi:hypothetical protein
MYAKTQNSWRDSHKNTKRGSCIRGTERVYNKEKLMDRNVAGSYVRGMVWHVRFFTFISYLACRKGEGRRSSLSSFVHVLPAPWLPV